MRKVLDWATANWRTNIVGLAVLIYAGMETWGYSACAGDPAIHMMTGIGLLLAKDASIAGHGHS